MNKSAKTKSIEIKSLRERFLLHSEYFQHAINPTNIVYTPYDGKDKYDVTWSSRVPVGEVSIICEVKVRNKSLKYGDFMIEKSKFDYLMSRANEFDMCFYINFFTDGIAVWDLKRIETPEWKIMTGQHDNYDNELQDKYGADLNTNDAIKIINKKINLYEYFDKAETEWYKRNK